MGDPGGVGCGASNVGDETRLHPERTVRVLGGRRRAAPGARDARRPHPRDRLPLGAPVRAARGRDDRTGRVRGTRPRQPGRSGNDPGRSGARHARRRPHGGGPAPACGVRRQQLAAACRLARYPDVAYVARLLHLGVPDPGSALLGFRARRGDRDPHRPGRRQHDSHGRRGGAESARTPQARHLCRVRLQ